MELFDFQTTLTVAIILTATAVVVFFDYLRRQRRNQTVQSIKAAKPSSKRPIPIFDGSPLDYAPVKKVAVQLPPNPPVQTPAPPTLQAPAEPLIAVATPSRPHIERRMERETVTVEMAPPSPSAPSAGGATPAPLSLTLPEFTIDAALWERLISSQSHGKLIGSVEHHSEPVDSKPISEPPPVSRVLNTIEVSYKMVREESRPVPAEDQPQGLIPPSTLEKWLETEEHFTGLVLSIGINESDSSMWHSRGLMQSVGNYIAGLLRAKDYYCRTTYDEFVVVCPGEFGAQAQRRLNHISERLWDYQLRGVGACSILFSWGGTQVENQPLADAVAAATERMRETKRSAKSAHARQAV